VEASACQSSSDVQLRPACSRRIADYFSASKIGTNSVGLSRRALGASTLAAQAPASLFSDNCLVCVCTADCTTGSVLYNYWRSRELASLIDSAAAVVQFRWTDRQLLCEHFNTAAAELANVRALQPGPGRSCVARRLRVSMACAFLKLAPRKRRRHGAKLAQRLHQAGPRVVRWSESGVIATIRTLKMRLIRSIAHGYDADQPLETSIVASPSVRRLRISRKRCLLAAADAESRTTRVSA
uniref:Ig-like domain-containing protein n=1 Tax=Macrostomum lignano TaxID=282301 RepID=A0A1I8FIY8_9PLAT